jgi:hypothetical protein
MNYNSAQIGTLTGTVDFKKTAPYFCIGWGCAVYQGSRNERHSLLLFVPLPGIAKP